MDTPKKKHVWPPDREAPSLISVVHDSGKEVVLAEGPHPAVQELWEALRLVMKDPRFKSLWVKNATFKHELASCHERIQ